MPKKHALSPWNKSWRVLIYYQIEQEWQKAFHFTNWVVDNDSRLIAHQFLIFRSCFLPQQQSWIRFSIWSLLHACEASIAQKYKRKAENSYLKVRWKWVGGGPGRSGDGFVHSLVESTRNTTYESEWWETAGLKRRKSLPSQERTVSALTRGVLE